ncbi:hypothetical protein ACNPNP_19650 [Microbacterium sp. AGC85]
MIPRPDRPDRDRLIADLGIQPRHRDADVEEVLAALAALEERRYIVLDTPRRDQRPLTDAEYQHAFDSLAELVEHERREDWW